MLRSLALAPVFVLLAGVAAADTKHFDGHAKVKGVQNGAVRLGQTKHGHAPHANMTGGKVTGLSVHHKGKDVTNAVSTKKVKTANKKHLADGVVCADGDAGAAANLWVGFAFLCPIDSHWYIFWFPVEVVSGGADGADDLDG